MTKPVCCNPYAEETGTEWEITLVDSAAQDLYTVRVAGPEMIAAVFRKARMPCHPWSS
jgi:hypothetical protein